MKTNPLVYDIKDGDLVMCEILQGPKSVKQILRITSHNLQEPDEKYSFAWLEFTADVLYTNYRLHPSMLKKPIGNCMALTEIIPVELIEVYLKRENMWKADMYLLSDNELGAIRLKFEEI